MGTINYGTNKYITIGYEPVSEEDILLWYDDPDMASHEEIEDRKQWEEEYSRSRVQKLIDNTPRLEYYHLEIEPGYYEGFYVKIESDFEGNLEDDTDKDIVLKETDLLKGMLFKMIEDPQVCVCSPGWGTTYYNKELSKERITQAVEQIKTDIEKETEGLNR